MSETQNKATHQELDERERFAAAIADRAQAIRDEFLSDEMPGGVTPAVTVDAIEGLSAVVGDLASCLRSTIAELHAIPRPPGFYHTANGMLADLAEVTGENRPDEPGEIPGVYVAKAVR
jgi:hypothetical protein